MLELWQLAVPVGHIIGTLPMLIVYLSGAVAAGLTHVLLNPAGKISFRYVTGNVELEIVVVVGAGAGAVGCVF